MAELVDEKYNQVIGGKNKPKNNKQKGGIRMARIRSIKPEFFKHGELQDLETNNPGQYIMLVYAGLWTQCDKNGIFYYKTRDIKNAILPYINFDMQITLDVLEKEGYFIKYKIGNREYGFIPNFVKYQFPSVSEKKCPSKYPLPPKDILETISSTEQYVLDTGLSTSQSVPSNDTEHDTEHNTELEGYKDIRIKDKGERRKDIPEPLETKPTKPIELLFCEPKNDIERVNKKWLENYISLHGQQPINLSWNISTPLVSKTIKQAGIEKVLQALDTAMKDDFCIKSGYLLKIIMSSNVISRLVNKSNNNKTSDNSDKMSLSGLNSIINKGEKHE